jgi:hypothetical protein
MKTARKKKLFLNLCHKMTSHLTKQAFEIKYNSPFPAGVAELADALRSGRSELTLMRVQIPPSAQIK